jgi:hypothetical protein
MAPLPIEVLTYAPTEFFHCLHCEATMQAIGLGQAVHREQRAAAFPPDLQAAYAALGDWVRALSRRHGDRVAIRIVDAASLEGVYKSLRYRTRRYPTVVIGGTIYRDAPYDALTRAVDAALGATPVT